MPTDANTAMRTFRRYGESDFRSIDYNAQSLKLYHNSTLLERRIKRFFPPPPTYVACFRHIVNLKLARQKGISIETLRSHQSP